MNTSDPVSLPALRPVPSLSKRPSPVEGITVARMKPFILLLVFSLQILTVRTDQDCYNITSSKFSTCQVCQKPLRCTYVNNEAGKQPQLDDCISQCCNPNKYDNTNKYSACYSTSNVTYSSSASSLSLATILIIIFFSIPAGICLLIAICTCVNNHRRTEQSADEPRLSAVNLAAFNLDDLGPLYQDRTQSCSICLDNDCNLRTRCGHSYHSQCLKAWIHKKEKCPLCVTQDFNPIILYCANCFKQVKMVLLMDSMSTTAADEWSTFWESKCQECARHLDDVISVEFSVEGEGGMKKEGEVGQNVERSQSHERVGQHL